MASAYGAYHQGEHTVPYGGRDAATSEVFYSFHHQAPQMEHDDSDDDGWDAARSAYQDYYLHAKTAADDPPRRRSGDASVVTGGKPSKSEGELQAAAQHHGGRSTSDPYLERRLHGKSAAIEYPGSYKGGAGSAGDAVGGEECESENSDEEEGDVRCYVYEANKPKPEKKHAGSNHDVMHHYDEYEARWKAREQWRHQYLRYGAQ